MKTVSRMIRHYILAAFGIVLLVLGVNAALFLGLIIHAGITQPNDNYYPISKFAAAFTQTQDGAYAPDPSLDWQSSFAWAMLLDHDGDILWSEALPQSLDHSYTVGEVAGFSRWYLENYPVMVYRNDYGLLVAGLPKNSITRFDFYMDNDILDALLTGFVPLLVLDGGIILVLCLLLGWRRTAPLRELAKGIDDLARGQPVRLEAAGTTAELAEKLNQTSRRLQEQAAAIRRRDDARTRWIAGVSHDIRTPLSLILGYAQQLEHTAAPEGQAKAAAIRIQSQKIKALIEDLNLTSKLEYDAQPLRLTQVQAGAMVRQWAAAFCDSLPEPFSLELALSEEAGRQVLTMDVELMTRAVDNLLNNSVRHNPGGCAITLRAEITAEHFVLTLQDDGSGYPPEVLDRLNHPDRPVSHNSPHILGLTLVRQIVQAHGGRIVFRNVPGAAAVITWPLPSP